MDTYFHKIDSSLLNDDFLNYLQEFSEHAHNNAGLPYGSKLSDILVQNDIHGDDFVDFFEKKNLIYNNALMNLILHDLIHGDGFRVDSFEVRRVIDVFNYDGYSSSVDNWKKDLLNNLGLAGIFLSIPSMDNTLRKDITKTVYRLINKNEINPGYIEYATELSDVLKISARHSILEGMSPDSPGIDLGFFDKFSSMSEEIKSLLDPLFFSMDPGLQKDIFESAIGSLTSEDNDKNDVISLVVEWSRELIRARAITGEGTESVRSTVENILNIVADKYPGDDGIEDGLSQFLARHNPIFWGEINSFCETRPNESRKASIDFIIKTALFPFFNDYKKEFLITTSPLYSGDSNLGLERNERYLQAILIASGLEIGGESISVAQTLSGLLHEVNKYSDIESEAISKALFDCGVDSNSIIHLFETESGPIKGVARSIFTHYIANVQDTWHSTRLEALCEVRDCAERSDDSDIKRIFNSSLADVLNKNAGISDFISRNHLPDGVEFIFNEDPLRDQLLTELASEKITISNEVIRIARITQSDFKGRWGSVGNQLKRALIGSDLSL